MDYAELQTLIAKYSDKADLGDVIPIFIATVESRMNRKLRVGDMTTRAYTEGTLDVDGNSEQWYDLPVDYRKCRAIKVDGCNLNYRTPEQMDWYAASNPTGQSAYYTIQAQQFRVLPGPAEGKKIEITYYQKVPSLSDANPTNWMLEDNFDMYNYGCLAELDRYRQNDGRAVMWEGQFEKGMAELIQQDKIDRWSGSVTTVRAG